MGIFRRDQQPPSPQPTPEDLAQQLGVDLGVLELAQTLHAQITELTSRHGISTTEVGTTAARVGNEAIVLAVADHVYRTVVGETRAELVTSGDLTAIEQSVRQEVEGYKLDIYSKVVGEETGNFRARIVAEETAKVRTEREVELRKKAEEAARRKQDRKDRLESTKEMSMLTGFLPLFSLENGDSIELIFSEKNRPTFDFNNPWRKLKGRISRPSESDTDTVIVIEHDSWHGDFNKGPKAFGVGTRFKLGGSDADGEKKEKEKVEFPGELRQRSRIALLSGMSGQWSSYPLQQATVEGIQMLPDRKPD